MRLHPPALLLLPSLLSLLTLVLPGCLANASLESEYLLDSNGLVLMPRLEAVSLPNGAKPVWKAEFPLASPVEVQWKHAQMISFVAKEYHGEDVDSIPYGKRATLARLLYALFALVRLPTRWTREDGPDRFSCDLQKRLALTEDTLKQTFKLEYSKFAWDIYIRFSSDGKIK